MKLNTHLILSKMKQKQLQKWLLIQKITLRQVLTVIKMIFTLMWRMDKYHTSLARDMATFQFCPGMVSTQMRALGALNLHGNTSLSL